MKHGNIPTGIDRNPLDDWQPMIEQLQRKGFQVTIEDPAEKNPAVRLVGNGQRLSLLASEVIVRFEIQGQTMELVSASVRQVASEPSPPAFPSTAGSSVISGHMISLLREAIMTGRAVGIEDSRERNPHVIGGLGGAKERRLYFPGEEGT